ncbi:hypothetical protein B0I35DRAFT_485593 [Stachybotrys elegans]|uniref:Uncharacterized protein n=1 Tax=Stachybotrys elegans TaxID=80388 RepID=A0A8K0SG06_9HYPO|nr:hypothetical protein B0I35DRAFT_485593 [Stachybotrys elegans]
MASEHGSWFEESHISVATEESALDFYEEHSIFYKANAEVRKLGDEMRDRTQREKLFDGAKPIILKDPRLGQIAESVLNDSPSFSYVFGPNPGNFFASTKEYHQDDLICVPQVATAETPIEIE